MPNTKLLLIRRSGEGKGFLGGSIFHCRVPAVSQPVSQKGRNNMDNGKRSRINIRIAKSERDQIFKRAKKRGISVSEYLRRRALVDDNRPVIDVDAETLRRLHVNLKRAGSNLNQVARELNTRHKPNEVEDEMMRAFVSLQTCTAEIARFLADLRSS